MLIVRDDVLKIINETEKKILFDTRFVEPVLVKRYTREILSSTIALRITKKEIIFIEQYFEKATQQPFIFKNKAKSKYLKFEPYKSILRLYNEVEVINLLKRRF